MELIKIRHNEWEAWQKVVKELRSLGVEINDNNNLNILLSKWATAFYALQIAMKP